MVKNPQFMVDSNAEYMWDTEIKNLCQLPQQMHIIAVPRHNKEKSIINYKTRTNHHFHSNTPPLQRKSTASNFFFVFETNIEYDYPQISVLFNQNLFQIDEFFCDQFSTISLFLVFHISETKYVQIQPTEKYSRSIQSQYTGYTCHKLNVWQLTTFRLKIQITYSYYFNPPFFHTKSKN